MVVNIKISEWISKHCEGNTVALRDHRCFSEKTSILESALTNGVNNWKTDMRSF